MRSLENRVAQLEGAQENADLKAMTDDELSAYASTLEFGTPECWAAVLAGVLRHQSAFPVVKIERRYGKAVMKVEDVTDPFKKVIGNMSAEKAQAMLDAMEQMQVIQTKEKSAG